jgi:hypothetical protein
MKAFTSPELAKSPFRDSADAPISLSWSLLVLPAERQRRRSAWAGPRAGFPFAHGSKHQNGHNGDTGSGCQCPG